MSTKSAAAVGTQLKIGAVNNLWPAKPTLGSSAGGAIAATTYYVRLSYVYAGGETVASPENSQAVALDFLLTVTSPAAQAGATGYNVYAATTSGAETKQNATPIAIGTGWTEPTSGLISGAALPGTLLAELTSITGPSQKAKDIDATNMDSPSAFSETIIGILDGGEIQVAGNWTDVAAQLQAESDFSAKNLDAFSIQLPGALGQWNCQGYWNSLSTEEKHDSKVAWTGSIKITGVPVFG